MEKKISYSVLAEKLKSEFDSGLSFIKLDCFRYFNLMIDVSDGSVWSDCYISENDFKRYRSGLVKCVSTCHGRYLYQCDYYDDLACALFNAVSYLEKSGWEVYKNV